MTTSRRFDAWPARADAELDRILGSAPIPDDVPLSQRIRDVAGDDYELPPPPPAPPSFPLPDPADAEPPRRSADVVTWARRAALVAVAVGAALALITGLTSPPAHAATAAPATVSVGPSAPTCRAALTYGEVRVTRTTGRIGNGERRYWTSVTLATTGDEFRLVVNRVVGRDPISGVVNRVQRGIGGDVNAPRSWGASSRTSSVVLHVAGIDINTGRIFVLSC